MRTEEEVYISKYHLVIRGAADVGKAHGSLCVDQRRERCVVHKAAGLSLHSHSEGFPYGSERLKLCGEKEPVGKIDPVAFAVSLKDLGAIDLRIRRDR